MAPKVNGDAQRPLPKRRNPLLGPDETPEHSELTGLRRLGQTDLKVRPGQVGLVSATKPENLGPFDYAHLRAPLPENLKGSEVFAPQQNQPHPTSYFLMRRSRDGFVSATGMFKAAFPWAKHAEETAEKEYVKSLASVSQDEVAGNVWISEHYAIELADDYGIVPWIHALLDSAPIPSASEDAKTKSISPPPKFKFTAGDKAHLPQTNGTPARGARAGTPKARGRPKAGSPEKRASPQKSMKKPRATKASKEANAAATREANASLQAALDGAASVADSESVSGEKVKVDVETNVETNGDTETTTTNVTIEMPKAAPELPLPENPEEMIEKAKEMVEEARKLDGQGSSSNPKRKAEELDDDEEGNSDGGEQPAKRTRLLEQQVKKQKIRTRAIIGVAATLVVGAVIPYFT